ncbi:MAG: HNH endonuclease [Acidobacteria bacterium]|nr:HNH endonuclease [Acidobacteriota bacterium]
MKPHRGSNAQWQYTRLQVLNRDDWRCTRCGSQHRLEVDHIVPLTEGGTDALDNLRVLCRDCHVADTRERFQPHVVGQSEWGAFAAATGARKRRLAGLP